MVRCNGSTFLSSETSAISASHHTSASAKECQAQKVVPKWNNANILTFGPARNSWGVMRMTLSCHIYCFILKRKEITSMDLMLRVAYMERLIYYLLRVPEAKVNPSFSKKICPWSFIFQLVFLSASCQSWWILFAIKRWFKRMCSFLPHPCLSVMSSAFQKAPKHLSCWLDSKMTTY